MLKPFPHPRRGCIIGSIYDRISFRRNLVLSFVFMKKIPPLFSREGERGRVFCPSKM